MHDALCTSESLFTWIQTRVEIVTSIVRTEVSYSKNRLTHDKGRIEANKQIKIGVGKTKKGRKPDKYN